MNEMIKKLIAIGAATTANCVPCLNFHYKKALELGATNDDIKEAIDVGRMVRRGAARSWDKEAKSLLVPCRRVKHDGKLTPQKPWAGTRRKRTPLITGVMATNKWRNK